jgi:hypothetical protein
MGHANPDAVTQIANGLSTTTFWVLVGENVLADVFTLCHWSPAGSRCVRSFSAKLAGSDYALIAAMSG